MTTSSNPNGNEEKPPNLDLPTPAADVAWRELADSIPREATELLDEWMDAQLAVMESQQERFVTNRTLLKSLRR